jgi:HD-like signal output (HDOD) protein
MINEILNKLYTIDHIPALPIIKNTIEDAVKSVNFKDQKSLAKLAWHISFDPSMSIEFLKIANSGTLGYKNKISSVSQALLVLDDELINLIINQHPVLPALSAFQSVSAKNYLLIIKHSIEVYIITLNMLNGILINYIANENFRDELLIASVLHDIGLLFLLLYFPDEYNKTLSEINKKTPDQKRSSTSVPDHAFIGSILCEHWKLPYSIRSSIAFHHYPWVISEEKRFGSDVLYLADALSSTFYEVFYDEKDIYSIEEHIVMKKQLLDIIEKYNISITDIAEIREDSLIQAERIISDLGFEVELGS